MGSSRDYKCTNCGYTAHICGGRDQGMFAVMKTYACENCQTLSDLQIGERGMDYVDYSMPENAEVFNIKLLCPDCNSRNIHPWDPINCPCPECGVRMKADPLSEVMWD